MISKQKNRRYPLMIACVVLAIIIVVIGVHVYGWGRRPIEFMDFSANDVERIELSCVQLGPKRTVTDPSDIQAIIDSTNAFRYSGNELKDVIIYGIYGIGMGGLTVYNFDVYLRNGEVFSLSFYSNDGEQELSDMEVTYRIREPEPDGTPLFFKMCRGSMETFYEMYEKYQ